MKKEEEEGEKCKFVEFYFFSQMNVAPCSGYLSISVQSVFVRIFQMISLRQHFTSYISH